MRKATAWAIIAAVFAALFALSFESWPNLTIDGGREMNAPLRLLDGETIYSDVYYLYGPLAPYVNAALYGAFGVHLNTLYGAGVIASVVLVALLFRLGERFGGTWEALIATWAVVVLCIFKQNGNYIFPYAYAAVYGTVLGLGALSAGIGYIHTRRHNQLTIAGALTGLALICKLEFGFAAAASLVAVAATDRRRTRLRVLARGLWPAVAIPAAVYGFLLLRVPWNAIVMDTFLWPAHIPAELVYFNKTKLGLHDPWKTVRELVNAVALVGMLAFAIVFAAAAWTARSLRTAAASIRQSQRRGFLGAGIGSIAVFVGSGLVLGTRWDVSPLRALPVLCVAVIIAYAVGSRARRDDAQGRARLVLAVYSLAVLGRVVLRVPSGGAYGGYLLPVPLLLFTHLAMHFFQPLCANAPACAARAHRFVVVLFVTVAIAATAVIGYRYVDEDYVRLHTDRGSVRLPAAEKAAFDAALALMTRTTEPGDYVWAVPEGSSLNFLGERRAPLRHEILTPGFLDVEGERRAIQQLHAKRVPLVLVLNRPMVEFGCQTFGRDCYRVLMEWIDDNYRVAERFGERGGRPLITAYRR